MNLEKKMLLPKTNGMHKTTKEGDEMNKEEVIRKIGKKNWKNFSKFMNGQTVGIRKDGKTDYYECDVNNFINHMKGKPTFFD